MWWGYWAPFPFQSLWTAMLLPLPHVQWGPALQVCLSPPPIPHFALCQWFLSYKRSFLLHMTSGLNRLTAGKFVNVCLGRCTSQKHVWIATAGKVQFNTTWVLPTHEFTIPCRPHSAQGCSSLSHLPQPLLCVSHLPHITCAAEGMQE